MRLPHVTIVIFLAVFFLLDKASAANQDMFKKFKGPKPGQWLLSAKVTVPGAKKVVIQDSLTCIKPGEDLKQRALGQLGDSSQGCVVSITKDTADVGAMTTKCPSISASVEMTRINDKEFRYDVNSSMAKVMTSAKFKAPVCAAEPAPPRNKKSSCDSCNQTVTMMREQCARLSDASIGQCQKSVAKLNEQCTAQCKAKK